MKTRLSVFSLALLASTGASAQDKDTKKWDVTAPPMTMRQVPIDVSEGTWMNIDVSPDGSTIAFDLLGDIYTIPIGGGRATRIAAGMSYETQPRFSPDGRQIAFTSDRGGGDNIWLMNVDGSGQRQLTVETYTLLNNPTWSPDGNYIAVRKHLTAQRSAGTGEIWLYHVTGGNGVALVERPNPQHQKELGEPMFSSDGTGIYFSRNTTPGPVFAYAQNTNQEVFAIERYDMKTGERTTVAGGPGGAVRPEPSPDGRMLAYVKRERAKSKLYLMDLKTGESRKIYDDLDLDMQETWAVHGVYPNMGWTPDSRSIVFWAGGKIRRVNTDGTGSQEIPFQVSDSRAVIDPPRPTVHAFSETFTTKMPRFAALSPDGRRVVFESLGRLYVKPVSGGAPRPLTSEDDAFQFFPSWSRDGSRIVFVSWNDQRLGEIRTVAPDGSSISTVTDVPGHYRRPRFSPDGSTIVFERGRKGNLTAERYAQDSGVYKVAAKGGSPVLLVRQGGNPHFGATSDRLYVQQSIDYKVRLVSVDMDGRDERTHAQGDLVTGYEVSPTGDALAFGENYEIFVIPFFSGAKTIDVGSKGRQFPAVQASKEGGRYPSWSADGGTLSWSLGPTLYTADRSALVRAGGGYTPPASGETLAIPVRADVPKSQIALIGAKVITMADEAGGIVEDGVVIVQGNRIQAIGRRGEIAIPAGARQIDVTGKTIIPGIIDAHAHGSVGEDELIPQQNWQALAHLAFGVTTIHDPANLASHIFPVAEMQRAGIILAPRTFSSGDVVYGARNGPYGQQAEIDSYEDALAHVRRLKAQGAHSIKNYNQPRRDQRQQVVAAALAENIAVVAEGGSLFELDMSLIADGNTTLEHNLPQARLYKDVLDFYGQTKVGYTPTLGVTYGGLGAEPYWSAYSEVWQHPLLTQHVPAALLSQEHVRVTVAPEEDYMDQVSAATAKQLFDRDVPVSIGSHGQQQGLAAHWEMWSFVRGGWTPIEALRAATAIPARALGFLDIGTLEPGKLADLVILDADPLANIQNSDNVNGVMLNGRLYDAETLDEEVTGVRRRQPYYWQSRPAAADTL